jgi:CRISPR/Cas system-associated exonuclease Cas4 (RecB family)
LHFLESGLVGKSKVGEKDVEKITEKIREVAAGLRQQAFLASPAYMACNYCAFNQICPHAILR